MAVNVPLILINDLPEQEIPTDDVYLIIGGNDAKKVKISNFLEHLKERLQIEEIKTDVKNLSESIDKKQDAIEDTGWVECTYGNGITPYSENERVKVRKIGNIVYLSGTVTNTTKWKDHQNFLTLPDKKLAPKVESRFIMQGSGSNRYLLTVKTNGVITASRYSNNANTSNELDLKQWLNVYTSWVTG